jgi:uncharacterized protein YbjT (DUF2867 family)
MTTAWIAGATGLVGSKLLARLLDDSAVAQLVSLGRSRVDVTSSKLLQRHVDFAALDVAGLPAPNLAFCALGTTIGKAGSQQAFRAVDHDAVLSFAKAALAAGAKTFLLVSALGANAGSSVFYNRVKGETETDLRALGFASLVIAQPSLLLGDRVESRPAERVAVVASRFLAPLLKPFASRPIEADAVARALVAAAHQPPSGTTVYHSGALQTLGAADER